MNEFLDYTQKLHKPNDTSCYVIQYEAFSPYKAESNINVWTAPKLMVLMILCVYIQLIQNTVVVN